MCVCGLRVWVGVCKCFQNEHQLFPGTCMDNALYLPSGLKTSLKILYLKINGNVRNFNGSKAF